MWRMAERVVLTGDIVTLRPMTVEDVDGLVAAASEDRSTYGFTPVPDGVDAMHDYVSRGSWPTSRPAGPSRS